MLSSLSKTPPWPGIKLEKSFTLNLLFIAEKTKSIGNFDYETEKVELENLLVNIQGNN